jgi:hypothetical protein
MAAFKDGGLYLENLVSTPTLPLSGHVTVYALADGTINAVNNLGNVIRIDNAALESVVATISATYTTLTTTASISAYLLSQIISVSGSLVTETANRIAGDAANHAELVAVSGALSAEDAYLQSQIDSISATTGGDADAVYAILVSVSGDLQDQIDLTNSTLVSVSGYLQAEIDALSGSGTPIVKGSVACNTIDNTYLVTHSFVTNNDPIVSLEIPSGSDTIFVQGVYNVSVTGFSVALSDVPSVSGYRINYMTVSDSGSAQVVNAAGVAGTYTKVTTNSFGQVIAGAQAALTDLSDVYGISAVTTDDTVTEMFVGGVLNSRIVIPVDKAWTFVAYVSAKRTDGDSESSGYKLEGYIDNSSGTVDLFGSVFKTVFGEVDSDWDVNAEADLVNSALVLKVTGEVAKNINWAAKVIIVEA